MRHTLQSINKTTSSGWSQISPRALAAAVALLAGVSTSLAGPAPVPCPLWDNGPFDNTDGRLSMVITPEGATAPTVDNRLADDFYLEPGYIHHITGVNAVFFSTTEIPEAKLEIRADCNGTPGNVLLTSSAAVITPGAPFQTGLRYTIAFSGLDLWLHEGVYWVTVVGVSDAPASQFFWGYTPDQKGLVSKRKVAPGPWEDLTQLCCNCKDLSFSVVGKPCKILHDNGTWNIDRPGPLGAPSLVNGATSSMNARSADNFVTNPCQDADVCYIEAYIYSNCPNARVEIYEQDCQEPLTSIRTLTPTRIVDTGRDVEIGGKTLNVLCLQFCDGFGPTGLLLKKNKTYWISAYGLGDGSFGSAAYFARNYRCDKPDCLVKITPGVIIGPAVSRIEWSPIAPVMGADMDFAFQIGVRDDSAIPGNIMGTPVCLGDVDASGRVDPDDLFTFLDSWFVGCP